MLRRGMLGHANQFGDALGDVLGVAAVVCYFQAVSNSCGIPSLPSPLVEASTRFKFYIC
jgi:hypothetical protein